ncbi:SigE family RNA polymerase sigma factor [Solwaraspora sp. WMMD406]|uniref:SigE family RNA polymerase sigma factor n=1 Tax=Solwaraspora sp. WMMD406 TaxID=3016095 RepID=UPI002415E940|nr:SigE family RNA polymerase sigma factor [Solwaraspora sp. WMMD406]MDG4768113.1 SigE family RNA polymerase sigma factor [Solwaraspora sp. WMMD406]
MTPKRSVEDDFRDFVASRSGALLRTAYLLAGDWATAEDLLQTALTKTYLAWKRLGEIEAVEPYARRVLVNTATSWWRRRWHGERPTENLPEQAGPDMIQEQLDRDVLWRHVKALPARQRAVLVLRFYEDLSEAQTAALLNISPGTVKSQTSRALTTLRKKLTAEGGEVRRRVAESAGASASGAARRTIPAARLRRDAGTGASATTTGPLPSTRTRSGAVRPVAVRPDVPIRPSPATPATSPAGPAMAAPAMAATTTAPDGGTTPVPNARPATMDGRADAPPAALPAGCVLPLPVYAGTSSEQP